MSYWNFLKTNRNQIATYSYTPKPIKEEYEIMSHLILDSEKYDDIGRIDLRDKTLTILREFIESIKDTALDVKTTSNTGETIIVNTYRPTTPKTEAK